MYRKNGGLVIHYVASVCKTSAVHKNNDSQQQTAIITGVITNYECVRFLRLLAVCYIFWFVLSPFTQWRPQWCTCAQSLRPETNSSMHCVRTHHTTLNYHTPGVSFKTTMKLLFFFTFLFCCISFGKLSHIVFDMTCFIEGLVAISVDFRSTPCVKSPTADRCIKHAWYEAFKEYLIWIQPVFPNSTWIFHVHIPEHA